MFKPYQHLYQRYESIFEKVPVNVQTWCHKLFLHLFYRACMLEVNYWNAITCWYISPKTNLFLTPPPHPKSWLKYWKSHCFNWYWNEITHCPLILNDSRMLVKRYANTNRQPVPTFRHIQSCNSPSLVSPCLSLHLSLSLSAITVSAQGNTLFSPLEFICKRKDSLFKLHTNHTEICKL